MCYLLGAEFLNKNNSDAKRQLASSLQDVTLWSQSSANMWHDFHSPPLRLDSSLAAWFALK